MEPLFKGKVVLVTGGGRGIGKATALRFAKEEASVAVADLNRKAAMPGRSISTCGMKPLLAKWQWPPARKWVHPQSL